ncbi:MAG TPA: hypothetical protein VF032_12680 [Thermoleophilaceae bacterium]
MNKFFLELWHDLRAKRLWPVAALLVVALVALPVVLKKHSSADSTAPAPAAATPSGADNASKAVVVADTGSTPNSTLGVFNKKDPFKPDKAALAAAHPQSTTPSSNSNSNSSNPSSGGGQTSQSGGSLGGGNSGNSGGSSGGSAPVVSPQPVKPKGPQGPFAYTVDVKFGKRGALRLHHNVQKLDVLPNQNNPMLVFMGVTSDGKTAVFLTDTSLKAAGEGTCKPDANTCSFLYLKLDPNSDTEDLSQVAADGSGTEYTLKLEAIHKVPVSQLAKNAKKAAKAARAEARRAHIGKGKPPTPFKVPLSAQLVPDTVG